MEEDDSTRLIPKLVICLIAAVSAAVVVTVYHCITTGHVRALLRIGRRVNTPINRSFSQRSDQMQQSSMESSPADLFPSHKYQKGSGLFADKDGICPVCLSEFEEGEELRTLPECMHSYHVSCIDMWLYSHSNCPMCRTDAAPSPQMLMHLLENSETPPPPETPPPAVQRQQANLNV